MAHLAMSSCILQHIQIAYYRNFTVDHVITDPASWKLRDMNRRQLYHTVKLTQPCMIVSVKNIIYHMHFASLKSIQDTIETKRALAQNYITSKYNLRRKTQNMVFFGSATLKNITASFQSVLVAKTRWRHTHFFILYIHIHICIFAP